MDLDKMTFPATKKRTCTKGACLGIDVHGQVNDSSSSKGGKKKPIEGGTEECPTGGSKRYLRLS